MRKKPTAIPVNKMADDFSGGISIEKLVMKDLSALKQLALSAAAEGKESHRHEGHSFFLLERGTVQLELDFQKYTITSPAVMYVHPDQVHHTRTSDQVIVSSWALSNEHINPDYLKILEDISPAPPLMLDDETFSILSDAVALFIKFSGRKKDKLYHSLLKDSCNALVALVISQYLAQAKPADKLSRFDVITKAFRTQLECHYSTIKSPAAYAQKLNISTPYLNECVKNTTGHPVSFHIQQRIILEAKRLLYHSDSSVKEIAAALGYDDYPYFSRLFTKITGMSAVTFRNKNLD